MPAGRNLKIAPNLRVAADPAVDARIGGLGLDFARVPEILDTRGRAEWQHLADTFRDDPTRFREGDRAAVTAFCQSSAMFNHAAEDLFGDGLQVAGRSSADRGRLVKNPAWQLWRDAGTQLRHWARELGLSPDSRARMGIRDDQAPPNDDNPFAAS